MFTNKKESNIQAGALVFEFIGEITARISRGEIKVEKAKLYEMKEFKVDIWNNFISSQDVAEFQIQLIQKNQKQPYIEMQKIKGQMVPVEIIPEDDISIVYPFFCSKDKIRVKKNDTQQLTIQFMPFIFYDQNLKIVLCDPKVGEFQLEVIGQVLAPDFYQDIKISNTIYVDSKTMSDFKFDYKNEQFIKALQLHEQRIQGKKKLMDYYNKYQKATFDQENKQYKVEMDPLSQFLSIKNEFTVLNPNKLREQNKLQKSTDSRSVSLDQDKNINKFNLSILFKNPINNYVSHLKFSNPDKTDVRIYKVQFSVIPKQVKATIELRTSAGESVTQDIPIQNFSDKDWNIKIKFDNSLNQNGKYLTADTEFIVKKKSIGKFNITFAPQTIGNAEAKLILQNPHTSDYYEYQIIGIADDPLALDHIVLNCVARKPIQHIIEIKCPYKDRSVQYNVETDLMHAEGPSLITVNPHKAYKYPLTVTPLLGGIYTGSITFYESNDRSQFIWYTISVNTEKPISEKNVTLETSIRKQVAFEIKMQNPLNEAVTYEIQIEGDGLFGDTMLQIMPRETISYELIFNPTRIFKSKGLLAFINEKLGEICYDLTLISLDCPLVRLPLLKTSIGKQINQEFELENPSDKDVEVIVQSSNQLNYIPVLDRFVIPAYDSVKTHVQYSPSDIDVMETAEINFKSLDIGNWYYFMQGTGVPPTIMDAHTMSCAMGQQMSSIIYFRNPFKNNIQLIITFKPNKKSEDIIILNLKKDTIQVPGLTVYQIPIIFKPKSITQYEATLELRLNEKVCWKYPIIAKSECDKALKHFSFKTQARSQLDQQLKINLPGLEDESNLENATFNIEIENIPEELDNLISRCVRFTNVKNQIRKPDENLIYNIRFNPQRPFKAILDLKVEKSGGGKWKFQLFLEATEPDVDAQIDVESHLNKTTSVSFQIENKVKFFSPFNAYFSADSDAVFQVFPKQGELEPIGREPKTFVINFTPIEYGKTKQAKLIIQTDELYWSYQINGTFPKYNPPKPERGLIDMTLDEKTLVVLNKQQSKQNFIKKNIHKSRQNLSPKQK